MPRQAGGVCAVEMALWDLADKAYQILVYQMLGGKFRDAIRLFCDTTKTSDEGLEKMVSYVTRVRKTEGYDIPLAADHFGHFDGIRIVPGTGSGARGSLFPQPWKIKNDRSGFDMRLHNHP